MRRKPRAPDEPLFSWQLVGWSVLQGGFAFCLVGAIFVIALPTWHAGRRGAGAHVLLAGAFDR